MSARGAIPVREPPAWPVEGGGMGALIRAHDWAATPLGPVEAWPQSQRTAVELLLATKFPAILAWGPELTVCAYNDAYRPLLGAKPEALGRPFLEVWSEERDAIAPQLDAALAGEAVFLEDAPFTLMRHGRPEETWFDHCYSPVRDETGAVAGILNTAAETTKRHLTEAALREAEDRLKAALVTGRMAAWYWDPEADEVTASDTMEDLFGLLPGETWQSSAQGFRLVHPDDRERHRMIVEAAGREGSGWHSEFRILRPRDGRVAWLEERANGTRDPRTGKVAVTGLVWDVTERKLAEAALRESEERFRRALEIETVGVIFLDLEGRITGANDAFLRMSGFTREDVEGGRLRWDALTPPEWMAKTLEVARELRTTGKSTPFQKEYFRKDGSRWWGLFAGKMLDDETAVEFVLDITERVRAEQAMRESEERFRVIVENARDHAILTTDPWGRITDWLPGAAAVFGWTAEEAVGRPGAMLFTPEDRASGAPEWELETARREGMAPDVRWHIRKDGARVFIEGSVTALRDVDGRARGFLKIGHDVTGRRAAEEALRRSEALFRTLATSVPQLVFRSEPDGWRTWPSPQWIEFTGLGAEESLGLGWLEAVHPDDREATLRRWAEAAASGEYYAEHRVRHAAGGEYRWHQTRARPLDTEDGAAGEWVGTMTDVHDLVQLRDQQGLLLNELSHRVKNTLAVILAMAGLTGQRAADLPSFLDAFEGRLTTLAAAHDLLTRGGWGGTPLPVLVRAALAAHDAGDDRIAIAAEDVRLTPTAAQSLVLALHELATNAVKYGALSAAGGRVVVEGRVEGEELVLAWHEAGGPPVTEPPAGRGFGTVLLERVIEYQHGGRVGLEWRREGVACTLRLPLAEIMVREAVPPPAAGETGHGGNGGGSPGRVAGVDGGE